MQLHSLRSLTILLSLSLLFSCSSTKKLNPANGGTVVSSLKFLDEYDIPYGLQFNNTTVGGLSGIDYDKKNDRYYFICDDRSGINPARFYTARIAFTQKGIDTVVFTSVNSLLQSNGKVYPNSKQDPLLTPDPEAMRYDPTRDELVWSSEGERMIREKDTVLADAAITAISLNGNYKAGFDIPLNLKMKATEKGPRQNSVFEGMSFADNFQTLMVSVEEPLYEDGPRADLSDNSPYIRILSFDAGSRSIKKQYAYKLDPVAHPSSPANAYKINGIPDILSIGENKLLVIERSFSTGRLACTVKLFITDLSEATDISGISSLANDKNFTPATKKLLLNMDDLGFYIDNIEGVTFGPILPDGHRTLLFIADNNFNPLEKSQVFLFEVID